MSQSPQYDFKAVAALVIVCVVWGTTYLANKYGVMTVPPLFFAGARMVCATFIMMFLFFGKIRKANWSKRVIRDQIILGFLLITLGNGVGTASLQYLDSGIASVFATLSPIIIVLLNYFLRLEGRLKPMGFLGMLLATAGCMMLFIADVDFYSSRNGMLGLGLFAICLLAWATGSLISKKLESTGHPFVDATVQMFSGGSIGLMVSFLIEDASLSQFGPAQWYAFVYAVIVGSVITYVAYVYALSKLPTTIVSIHSYINPLIALYIGHLFLDERWDSGLLISTATILTGVYLITKHFDRSKL